MPLINFGRGGLVPIIAPIGSGKTSLIKFQLLEHAHEIACCLLWSNIGIVEYDTNYNFVDKRYVRDTWDGPEFLEKAVFAIADQIKNHYNGKKYTVLIFDDCIGMLKGLFEKEETKKLIIELLHYNVVCFVTSHEVQKFVTTLMRNNYTDLFAFANSEPNGNLEILFRL